MIDKSLPPWLAKLDRQIEAIDEAIALLRPHGLEELVEALALEREWIIGELQERQARLGI